jgi:Ca2+-binding RTX toxin-like protein
MPFLYIPNRTSTQNAGADHQYWILDEGDAITTANTAGFSFAAYDYVTLSVAGSITSEYFSVIGSGDNMSVHVEDTGVISATGASVDGFSMSGSDITISNAGKITGTSDGVLTSGEGLNLYNSGTITGQGTGVGAYNADNAYIINTGVIRAMGEFGSGLFIRSLTADGHFVVENAGRIVGATGVSTSDGDGVFLNSGKIVGRDGTAFLGGDDIQLLTNKGEIVGDVSLRGGNDIYRGSGSVDGIVYGGAGLDELRGGNSADRLSGMDDNDSLFGRGGNDKLWGGLDQDLLVGGSGNDRLWGGFDNDVLFSGSGKDRLFGDDGDDVLIAQGGNDRLTGGDGVDQFIFLGDKIGTDRIKDFDLATELVDLTDYDIALTGRFWNKAVTKSKGDVIIDMSFAGAKGTIIIEDVASGFTRGHIVFDE